MYHRDQEIARKMRLSTMFVLGVVLACVTVPGASVASGTQRAPIKIGAMVNLTGPLASYGQQELEGARVGAAYVNARGGVMGRRIEIVPIDLGSGAAQAVQGYRTLRSEGVQYVVGMFSSDVCNAVGPITQELNMLYAGHCNDPSLLGPNGPKNFYMAAVITNAYPLGVIKTIDRRFPDIKTWDIFSLDYLTGQTMATLVEQAVLGSGAQVGTKVFAPLTATDVSPYINSLLSRGPDRSRGLIAFGIAAPGAALYKQGALAGLFARYGAVVPIVLVESTLDAVGSTLPRQFTQHDYCPCTPGSKGTPRDKLYGDLAAIWQRLYDHGPNATGLTDAGAVQAFAAAMQKVRSTKPWKVKRALQGLTFQSTKGPIIIHNRYFVQPMVAFECVGDSSAQRGWRCAQTSILDARQITPREFLPPVR